MREHSPIDQQHTQCPHCNTIFAISEEQLNALNGKVRCGYCYRTFNANETLISQLSDPEPETTPPTLPISVAKPDNGVFEHINLAKQEYTEDTRQRLSQTAAPAKKHSLIASFFWSIAVAIMLIVFIGQYGYFYRQDLAQKHPQLRPLLDNMCRYLPCPAVLIRDPAQLRLISHDMRSLPDNPQVLRVRGTYVNQADFNQPYPVIRLSLTDFNGKNIHRDFSADHYLAIASPFPQGIPPQAQIDIQLDVVDSNRNITGFALEAR